MESHQAAHHGKQHRIFGISMIESVFQRINLNETASLTHWGLRLALWVIWEKAHWMRMSRTPIWQSLEYKWHDGWIEHPWLHYAYVVRYTEPGAVM